MAENPIRKEDLVDFDEIQKSLRELIKTLEKLATVMRVDLKKSADAVNKSLQGVNASTKEGQQTIKAAAAAADKLAAENKILTQQDKQLLEAKLKLKHASSEEAKELIRVRTELQKVNQQTKDNVRLAGSQAGSLNKLRARLKQLTAEYNKMGPGAARKAAAEIRKLSDQIKKQEAAVGNNTRNVGNYSSAWKGAGKSILAAAGIMGGATIILRGMFNVIKGGFKTTFDFEQSMSMVKAITGATGEEFDNLRNSAIALGGSTAFTASQVSSLQKEYAKLGFTTQEILKITSATLDLAAATGEDLAQSASVAGATLRGFALDATEMQRVVDVMAKSFTTSALDLSKFQTAMANVAPVANAVGETIETASAKLGILANAGLDASKSGTSLRNIFLELEKRGLTFDEAMQKINTSQNKASTSLELFGKRGAVSGVILAENIEKAAEMAEVFENAAGAAEEMAEINLDNVRGQITILKSAWEGLILRTNESTGALQGFLAGLTDVVTAINTKGKPAIDSMFDEKQIEKFGDKFRFFRDQGIGFMGTLTNSLFRGKKATQDFADEFARLGAEQKIVNDEAETAALEASAEERRINDARLLDIGKQIEEEEAIKEAQAKRTAAATKARDKISLAERKRLAKEGEESIKEIKVTGALETQTAILGIVQEANVDELAMEQAQAQALAEIDQEILEDKIRNFAERAAVGLAILGGAISSFASLIEGAKQKELSAAGDNAAARLKIEEEFAKKQQALAIGQAIVNAALGVTEIWKKFAANPIKAGILTAIHTAKMIGEIAIIKNQKFAEGGSFEVGGKTHASGGTQIMPGIEAEKGEYVSIFSRKATANYGTEMLEGITNSVNSGQFHEVWSNLNNQMSKTDPYTKKMYELMLQTPVIISHKDKIFKQYPGRIREN